MSKHTPESWYYEANDTPEPGYDNLYLYTVKQRTPLDGGEAAIHFIAARVTYEEHACVLAAAPELLEALEYLLDNAYPPEWSIASSKPFDAACKKARAVIAKARGRAA